jgi:hypothetical protein
LVQQMVERVCFGLVAEKASARRCSRFWGGTREREEAAQDVHSTGNGGFAVALDSTLTKLGEVSKTFRLVFAVISVTFEGAEGLIGIPGRLGRGQIELINRNVSPRVARAVLPGLSSLCRMEVWGPAQAFHVCMQSLKTSFTCAVAYHK